MHRLKYVDRAEGAAVRQLIRPASIVQEAWCCGILTAV
jgi:hypothetical protein